MHLLMDHLPSGCCEQPVGALQKALVLLCGMQARHLAYHDYRYYRTMTFEKTTQADLDLKCVPADGASPWRLL